AVTKEHHYTTDGYEYDLIGARGWTGEGVSHRVLPSAAPFRGVTPIPLYRLYHAGIQQHLWTTDANEAQTLPSLGWTYEGIDGYVLGAPIAGVTVPLYRLSYAVLPLHLWTTDLNQYNVLPAQGWIQVGV